MKESGSTKTSLNQSTQDWCSTRELSNLGFNQARAGKNQVAYARAYCSAARRNITCSGLVLTVFLLVTFSEKGLAQTVFGQLVRQIEQQKLAAKPKPSAEKAEQNLAANIATPTDNPQVNSSPSSSNALSAREKLAYGFKRTFLRPTRYATTALSATITQLREEDQPHKDTGDKFADGLSRYAIKFATGNTKRMFASGIYPALFHQDPRYKPSEKRGFTARVMYAASRVFVTEGDNGELQPNYSQLGANLTASSLANIWERNTPGRDRIGVGPTFQRFARMTGYDILSFIIFREFGPDIKRKILRRK